MSYLLFKKDSKPSLFSTAGVLGTALKLLVPNAILLAKENIKLLRLVQKLTNSILNDSFNAKDVDAKVKETAATTPEEPAKPEEAKAPEAGTAAPPAAGATASKEHLRYLLKVAEGGVVTPPVPSEASASGDPDVHQARAVLIKSVEELLKFSRQLTGIVRGHITGTPMRGEKTFSAFSNWMRGAASRVADILKKGGFLDQIKDATPDDFSRIMFSHGDDIVTALYEGLQKYKDERALNRVLVAINEEGGLNFLRERKKDILMLLISLFSRKQKAPAKKKSKTSAMRTVENIDRLLMVFATAEAMSRYSRMADTTKVFAAAGPSAPASPQLDKINLVTNIIKLLHTPQFLKDSKSVIERMDDKVKAQVEEAMKFFGMQPDIAKLDAKVVQSMAVEFQNYAAASAILKGEIGNLENNDGLAVKKHIEAINSATDPAAKSKSAAELNTLLTKIEDTITEINKDLHAFKDGKGDIYQKMIELHANLVSAMMSADDALFNSIKAIRGAIAPIAPQAPAKTGRLSIFRIAADAASESVAPVEAPAEAPAQAQPAAASPAPSPAAPPPTAATQPAAAAKVISDEISVAFIQSWTAYVQAAEAMDASLQGHQKAVETGAAGVEGGADEDSEAIALPRLSFKDDEDVAPILREIKAWFAKNEELIGKVIKPAMEGTGMMGTKSAKDMRTIATIANDIKTRATNLIDQLLK